MTRLLPRQRTYHYKWRTIGILWQCSMQKAVDWQGWISASFPKSEASWKKLYHVYGRITGVLFLLSFYTKIRLILFIAVSCVWKRSVLVCWKNLVLLVDNTRPHSARITQGKNIGWRLFFSTPSTIFTWPCSISCFSFLTQSSEFS